ncbi:MAG: zf-TFIIB domain-containing protein, partial [Gemmatimonadota bacterium]
RCSRCRGVWLDPGECDAARQRLRQPVPPSQQPHREGTSNPGASLAMEGLTEVLLWLGRVVS